MEKKLLSFNNEKKRTTIILSSNFDTINFFNPVRIYHLKETQLLPYGEQTSSESSSLTVENSEAKDKEKVEPQEPVQETM